MVVLDANVVYSAIARTVFIDAHLEGACRIHWSERILDEAMSNLGRNRNDMPLAHRIRTLMNDAVPSALVAAKAPPRRLVLPDDGDSHVVATAIACRADWIATFNLRHFPKKTLEPLGVTAADPNVILELAFDASPGSAARIRKALIAERAVSEEQLKAALTRARMRRTAATLGLPLDA